MDILNVPAFPMFGESQWVKNVMHFAEKLCRAYFLAQQRFEGDVTREGAATWRPSCVVTRVPACLGGAFGAHVSCGGATFVMHAADPMSAIAALVAATYEATTDLLEGLTVERGRTTDPKELEELAFRIGALEDPEVQLVERMAQAHLVELGYTLPGMSEAQRTTGPLVRAPYLESQMPFGQESPLSLNSSLPDVVFETRERALTLQYKAVDARSKSPVGSHRVNEWGAEVRVGDATYVGQCVTQRGARARAYEAAAYDILLAKARDEAIDPRRASILAWLEAHGYHEALTRPQEP